MPDLDDLLQQKLAALEAGQPLESILADLPAGAEELMPLLKLAASVRTLEQPEPSAASQRKVMAAAREITRPAGQVGAHLPTRPNPPPEANGSIAWNSGRGPAPVRREQPSAKRRSAWNPSGWQPRVWMGALVGVFLVIVLAVGGLAWWLSSTSNSQVATLMDVSGKVEVASSDTAQDWQPVKNGAEVSKGQRIRTADGSSATLVFYEGTRSTIGANADLTLTKVEGGQGKLLRVLINQYSGKTGNSVVPFRSQDSSFVVNTPSGSASVHGTRFDVEIEQGGQTRFAVSRGKVLVYNDQNEVFVKAGQMTRTGVGEAIDAPAYQFELQGAVEQIDGSTWTVQGVPFTVTDQTNLNGDFTIGTRVLVEGHIEGDTRVADNINPAGDDNDQASFSGAIESMEGTQWQIGGASVTVNQQTEKPDNLKIGDVVNVTFSVENGQWVAQRIESTEEPNQPEPTPSNTPDANAHPELVFSPEEVSTNGCGDDFTLNGTLTNQASEPGDDAANVQLGYVISRGGEYVNSVELSPANWATIQPGEAVDFNIHVVATPDYRDTRGNQKQIKLRVFVASETNQPDNLNSRLTVTIVSNCKLDETETPEPSETATGTPETTVTPTLPGSATPINTTCTGANPHPEGMRLAQRYGVPYEEIMGWFCQNFGFGEIDLAYSLSQQSGKPVEEIFAMRRSGLGWGEIKKQLETVKPGNGNNNGKNNDGNNNKPANPPRGKPTKKPK